MPAMAATATAAGSGTFLKRQSTAAVASAISTVAKALSVQILNTGILLWLASLILWNPAVTGAFGVSQPSLYANLIFAGILWGLLSRFLSVGPNALSRSFEFQADRFAAAVTRRPADLARALIQLGAHSLAQLNPHPIKVALDYSHPPLLDRIRRLNPEVFSLPPTGKD